MIIELAFLYNRFIIENLNLVFLIYQYNLLLLIIQFDFTVSNIKLDLLDNQASFHIKNY